VVCRFPTRNFAVLLVAYSSLRSTSASAQAPWAATQAAAPIGISSGTLNGMATPRGQSTRAWFEWGTNASYDQATSPVDVGSGGKVVQVSTALNALGPGGAYHYRLVALNASGVSYGADHQFTTGMKVSAWGDFSLGRPPLAGGLTNVVAIGCGHTHGLAVRNDGTVASWFSYGTTDVGQTNVPSGLSNVVAVAGGWVHSLALRQDGTVVAWGRYFDNFNNIEAAFVPGGLSNVIAIAGGDEHSVALQNDGTVRVWGVNSYGQMNIPPTVTNVVAISAGSTHTLALKADGTVVAWGTSVGGDMTPPAGLTNVVAIASEGWHNLALRADGTVVAWGNDDYGQTQVPAQLANVVAIAAGFRNSLALLADGALVAWGETAYVTSLPPSLLNPVGIGSGDFESIAINSVGLPPIAFSSHGTCLMNNDLVLSLSGWDPNGDALNFRTTSLPVKGLLYQFSGNGRGSLIGSTNAIITDPLHRVIFAPEPGSFGVPYASFSYVSDNGRYASSPVLGTMNVIAAPVIQAENFVPAPGPGFTLNFAGISNVTYQVFSSTDLLNWSVSGYASQPSPGQFRFLDPSAIYIPQRFYRINLVSPQ
jgi:hypothetical protein